MQNTYRHITTSIKTTDLLGLSNTGLFYKTHDNGSLSIINCSFHVSSYHWLATERHVRKAVSFQSFQTIFSASSQLFNYICNTQSFSNVRICFNTHKYRAEQNYLPTRPWWEKNLSYIHLDLPWWPDSQLDWSNTAREEMAFKYPWCPIVHGHSLWHWRLLGSCKS